jgi:hypothetical protein
LVEADFLVNIYEDEESLDAARRVKDGLFKTKTGKKYISDMFNL